MQLRSPCRGGSGERRVDVDGAGAGDGRRAVMVGRSWKEEALIERCGSFVIGSARLPELALFGPYFLSEGERLVDKFKRCNYNMNM